MCFWVPDTLRLEGWISLFLSLNLRFSLEWIILTFSFQVEEQKFSDMWYHSQEQVDRDLEPGLFDSVTQLSSADSGSSLGFSNTHQNVLTKGFREQR